MKTLTTENHAIKREKKTPLLRAVKSLLLIATISSVLYACKKNDIESFNSPDQNIDNELARPACGTMQAMEDQMKADPTLQYRLDAIENFTQNYVSNPAKKRMDGDIMNVPVVVYVVWRTSTENIPLGQIQSQIDVLNEDFSGTNADISKIPAIFQPVSAGDTKIRFYLDTVIRKQTTVSSWTTDRKIQWDSCGGISIPNEAQSRSKLHIWVGTLVSGLGGFAQYPGCAWQTDGVVINNRNFGSRQKFSTGTYVTGRDLGRSTTHEVGHYFNLRHIWGASTCGSDLVTDTPTANARNTGCPTFPHYSTCTGTPIEMTMNYMDYVNDACMYMFSAGQEARMQATFALGGPRATLR